MKKIISLFVAALMITASALISFSQQNPRKGSFTKQTLRLDGEEITIIRDSFGVPHILAGTERGAYFGGGYAVAQDRLFQLERYRRDARGEMAEIDAQAFERDKQVRTLGYSEDDLQAQFDALNEEIKLSYRAYADGINAYIKEAVEQNKLPARFKDAGIRQPSTWRVTDSVAIGILMAHRFGSGGGGEAMNERILRWLKEKFGADAERVFDDLFWINDPKSPTTIPDESRKPAGGLGPKFRNIFGPQKKNDSKKPDDMKDDSSLDSAQALSEQRAVYEYAEDNDLPSKWGSYAWVIAPKRSVSGNAMLIGGPQMGFATPQIAHEIHYSAPNLNVIGMGFAGIPGVLIGHNDHIAWTTTSGITDMVDTFAEKLNPKNKHQYFYKGQWRDMEKRVEVIRIKGQEPRSIEVYRTVHGPVLSWDEKAGVAYSRAASFAGRELSNISAIYGFNRAKSVEEFGRYAESIYTNHNFFAADLDGNTGYWHCGKPPVRAKGIDPRLPTPGTGEYDWTGVMPFSEMPQMINPRQGYIINWNNKPARRWDNADRPVWGEIFRIHRIEQLIRAQEKLTFEQARDITQDIGTNDPTADYLKPHLLAAIERTKAAMKDARIKEAADYLRAWDNHATEGSIAKTLFDAWVQSFREAAFADEFKELDAIGAFSGTRNLFTQLIQPSFMLHALDGANSALPPSRDYFNGRTKDQVVVDALAKAIGEMSSRRGPQMNLWGYSAGEINFRPLAGIPRTDRGTYIQAIEMSRPAIRAVSILPPGQSEDPRSPHFQDQREMAGYWRFKQMLSRRRQVEEALAAAEAGNN
jgi:penicillin amidase